MDGFGASGPANQLYEYFGITVEEVVDSVKDCIKK
jgi:transketolase